MTVIYHIGHGKRERVPKVRATVLRRILWDKFGHRCAMVKTYKKPGKTIIHIKVMPHVSQHMFNMIANFTTFWDENADVPNPQVVTISYVNEQ